MLPQPWLWDGGISYRYDVKSDLFLSVLHYPQMACAVTLIPKEPSGFLVNQSLWNSHGGGFYLIDTWH